MSARPAAAAALLVVACAPFIARADDGAYATVVTGTRTEEPLDDTPVAVEVIDRAELEASGADSVAEALDAHPGLEVERGLAGAVLVVQGLDPAYTLVLVDGQRVVGRVDGGLDLARLPIGDVERIEIIKGPASALYGSDAIGGVVNVITRAAHERVEAEAYGSYGSFGSLESRARVAGGLGPVRLGVSGGFARGDGWDRDPSTLATDASSYDTGTVDVDLRVRPKGRPWRADASFRWLERDQRGVDASATGAIFDRRNLTETIDATLAPSFQPSAATRLRVTGHFGRFRDQFLSDQRGADALDSYQDTRETLAEGTLQLDWLTGDHVATVGVDALYEALRSQRLAGGEGSRSRAALFAQDEWRVLEAPRLTLVPALRVDHDTRFGDHVTPRLALRWDARDDVVVRAALGSGYRAPDFKQLYLHFENPGVGYVVDGNPGLGPETSRSATLAAEWRPEAHVWLSAGLFRHELADLILATQVAEGGPGMPQRFSYVNVASATSQGGELALRFTPWASLRLDAGYTLTFARDDATGEPPEGRERHRASFAATWRPRPGGLELHARGSVVGPRPFHVDEDGDGMSERRDAASFALLDARVGWRFAERFTVFAGVDNLLDAGDVRDNPIQPRTVYAGASARY